MSIKFDVAYIVMDWLEERGYQGLAGEDCGCGDGELFSCGYNYGDCMPAYKWECNKCSKMLSEEGCEFYVEGKSTGCWFTEKQDEV